MAAVQTSSSATAKGRAIVSFPPALFPQASPYQQCNFSATVNTRHISSSTVRSGKVVFVGDHACGKEELIRRFCNNIFEADNKATIGVDFEVEKFTVMSVPYNLQIWDTAGAERFKCIAASYYRGANIVVIVFDMSDSKTLRNAVQWKEEARRNAGTDSEDQLLFLVGSKKDLLSPSACASIEQQALKVAQELNAEYWSVSALTGENVKELFFRMAALSFDRTMSREREIIRLSPDGIGNNGNIRLRQSTREEEIASKKMKSRFKRCN